MFKDCTIEVKSERNWWKKTGNIAIEYEYRGKPSGIYATKSDYWFHRLELKKKEFCTQAHINNKLCMECRRMPTNPGKT